MLQAHLMHRRSRGKQSLGLVISIGVSPDGDTVGVLCIFRVFIIDEIKSHQWITAVTLWNVFHCKRQEKEQFALLEILRPDVFNGALTGSLHVCRIPWFEKFRRAKTVSNKFELKNPKMYQTHSTCVGTSSMAKGIKCLRRFFYVIST